MLDVATARARILAAFSPLPAEIVALEQARGRILAEPVSARRDQPPAAVSAMDGYAVRAADAGSDDWLEVVGEVAAGRPLELGIGRAQAARIFTGGLVPEGADAILIQENAEVAGNRVRATESLRSGQFVRPQGLDYRAGWVGLEPGTRIGPLEIGLAASLGSAWLSVRRKPRVGLIATGDELRLPGGTLAPHEIASSNSFMLRAMLEAWGAVPVDLGIAQDTAADLAAKFEAARGLDLLVTSGGASVGDHDLVRRVGGEQGLALDFWKIRMRPGKPLIFGRLGETPLLGLPGNPVSAAVCGIVFLRGAVRAMLGLDPALPTATARLARDIPAGIDREDYQRARRDDALRIVPAERQDSSMLATLARADVLLVRPPSAPALEAESEVTVIDLERVLAD